MPTISVVGNERAIITERRVGEVTGNDLERFWKHISPTRGLGAASHRRGSAWCHDRVLRRRSRTVSSGLSWRRPWKDRPGTGSLHSPRPWA